MITEQKTYKEDKIHKNTNSKLDLCSRPYYTYMNSSFLCLYKCHTKYSTEQFW